MARQRRQKEREQEEMRREAAERDRAHRIATGARLLGYFMGADLPLVLRLLILKTLNSRAGGARRS